MISYALVILMVVPPVLYPEQEPLPGELLTPREFRLYRNFSEAVAMLEVERAENAEYRLALKDRDEEIDSLKRGKIMTIISCVAVTALTSSIVMAAVNL